VTGREGAVGEWALAHSLLAQEHDRCIHFSFSFVLVGSVRRCFVAHLYLHLPWPPKTKPMETQLSSIACSLS
jgi:hypothetical protein